MEKCRDRASPLTDGAGSSFTLGGPACAVSSSCRRDDALVGGWRGRRMERRSCRPTRVRGITLVLKILGDLQIISSPFIRTLLSCPVLSTQEGLTGRPACRESRCSRKQPRREAALLRRAQKGFTRSLLSGAAEVTPLCQAHSSKSPSKPQISEAL